MTGKRGLRAVNPGDKPPESSRKPPATVVQAVADGSTRDVFRTMQERIARAIDDPNIRGADLAALTRRLHELRKEIEAIDAREAQDRGQGGEVEDGDFDASAV